MLSLDWNLVFTIINVFIFYLLIRKFLFRPINQIIAEREKLIQEKFDEAENKLKEANACKTQYEESMNHMEEVQLQYMQDAREKAQVEYNEVIKAAREKSSDILKRADEAAKESREKAIREVQNQIAELAIAAASQIAVMQASSAKDEKTMDDFLAKVGEEE